MTKSRLPGPGPVKIRAAPLLLRRHVTLVAVSVGRLHELFDAADVISEGSPRQEGERGRIVYYGSTSLLLRPGDDPEIVQQLALVLPFDPHARVRALRIAHREAVTRAGGPLGTLHAELSFGAPAPSGAGLTLALTIDVSGEVQKRSARTTNA